MSTKDRLLITGLKLYSSKGLNGVTLDDILADSNVKKGSFYHFFSSKDELLEESLLQYFLPVVERRFEIFRTSKLPFRQLIECFYFEMIHDTEIMIHELTDGCMINPRNVGLLMLEGIRAQRFAGSTFKTNQRQIRDAMIEKIVFEQHRHSLPLSISGSEIATLIITCGEGALYLSSWNSALYTNDELLKTCFCHLWNYFDLLLKQE